MRRHSVVTGLAGYKAPRTFDFVSALPRLATGKLYKQALRESYVAKSRERNSGSQRLDTSCGWVVEDGCRLGRRDGRM